MNRPETAKPTTKPIGEVRPIVAQAEKESSCVDLLEEILTRDNLLEAWQRVKANRGAAGIDGMKIEDFPDFLHQHWDMIRRKLLDGSYAPSPVRRVEIPKLDGTKRPLGIPTVLDRVIQQAIAQILTPIYDPTFSESSHGFYPSFVRLRSLASLVFMRFRAGAVSVAQSARRDPICSAEVNSRAAEMGGRLRSKSVFRYRQS